MITLDYIMIVAVIAFGVLGTILGFGKGIKILTGGIFGIVISIVNCYFLFGLIIHIGFVESFMNFIINGLTNASNWFCDFLLLIRIEVITVAVILFALVTIIRKIIVHLIASIAETDHKVFKAINKSLGAILSVAVFIIATLIVMQIILIIQKDNGSFYTFLKGSFFHLDEVYLNNPLLLIIKKIMRVS